MSKPLQRCAVMSLSYRYSTWAITAQSQVIPVLPAGSSSAALLEWLLRALEALNVYKSSRRKSHCLPHWVMRHPTTTSANWHCISLCIFICLVVHNKAVVIIFLMFSPTQQWPYIPKNCHYCPLYEIFTTGLSQTQSHHYHDHVRPSYAWLTVHTLKISLSTRMDGFIVCPKTSHTDIFQPDEVFFFYIGAQRGATDLQLCRDPRTLSTTRLTLCLLSHRAGDETPGPPLLLLPHLLTHHLITSSTWWAHCSFLPLSPSPLLFIYLSILPQLCGLPFLISSVKHDYYLLMPKLRGHSFCHPRHCIFPA